MAVKICLDAGHYGKTYNRSPVVPEYCESEMNWKLHLLLKAALERYGFEVITTRQDQEKDMAVYDRGLAAKGCDLFMSLHSNAAYSSKDPDEKKRANEKVDRVDIYAPISGKGHDLAKKLADCIAEIMGTNQPGFVKTSKNSSGAEAYGVLRGAAKVGVIGYLVEHSFHTNTRAAKWLLDNNNLARLAEAEAKVLAEHFGLTVNESDLTRIEGTAQASAYQMQEYIRRIRPEVEQSVLDMIPLYISEGTVEGIRGDIAFAQSCLETGNFAFKGSAVTLDQNNFCGMGVTENGLKGNSFDTPQQGIRAQIQHLKAYANDQELVNALIDPRFQYVERGCAPYVEWLGIKENPQGRGWAAGAKYGEKILNILAGILVTGKPRIYKKGDEGEEVRKIQKMLIALGYDLGTYGSDGDGADGEFGAKTEAAVKAFQTAKGLTATGEADAALIDMLEDAAAPDEEAPGEEKKPTHVLVIEGDETTLKMIWTEYGGMLAEIEEARV